MNMIDIIGLYEKLNEMGVVVPVAHVSIRGHIGVLLDSNGNFLAAKRMNEECFVPCTEKSEYRTSGTEPHLIHDNLSYVCRIPGYERRNEKYLSQLRKYIDRVDDVLAKAVYIHAMKNLLYAELEKIIKEIGWEPKEINVCFAVYGETQNTINRKWEKYYVSTLPINGICGITGEKSYIPDGYPRNIKGKGDFAKLFLREKDSFTSTMPEVVPGYVSAQKIIHAIQFMAGLENEVEVEKKK